MSHLNENDRKTISNMLSHKATCKEIASIIGCDPTTIAKEIKRNRVILKEALTDRKFSSVKNLKDTHMFVLIVATSIRIVRSLN